MRRIFRNEKGIALLTTLMLMVLGFAVVVTLLQLVTASSKLSRLEQRYATALDASKGGSDLMICMIQNALNAPPSGLNAAENAGDTSAEKTRKSNCMKEKLNNPTASWAITGTTCVSLANATDPNPKVQPDLTLTLGDFKVYAKIIDTVQIAPGSPPCNFGGCLYHTINVRSEMPNSNERADITFLYRVALP